MKQLLRRLTRPALLGTLRRTTPLSDTWGFDRGTPVDRYYIERFLDAHRQHIRGAVLEIKDSTYTDRFGTDVVRRDVLDIAADNPNATIVADLAAADAVPGDAYDCFILTQTLHLIYDVRAALRHAHRLLRPGGVLLATLPCASRISRSVGVEGDYWRFTAASARALCGEAFGNEQVTVQTYGNVLAAIAFLSGLAAEELSERELSVQDPLFPLLVTVVGVKS